MLKGVDNSVGIAFDKGIDDANIYDHRRMMSQKCTGKGRSCHTAIWEFLFYSALPKNNFPHLGKGSIFIARKKERKKERKIVYFLNSSTIIHDNT
jgi:hypothetical protein